MVSVTQIWQALAQYGLDWCTTVRTNDQGDPTYVFVHKDHESMWPYVRTALNSIGCRYVQQGAIFYTNTQSLPY